MNQTVNDPALPRLGRRHRSILCPRARHDGNWPFPAADRNVGRACLTMGLPMTVRSTTTMTQRGMHERTRLVNRIEDARTEQLLMDAGH